MAGLEDVRRQLGVLEEIRSRLGEAAALKAMELLVRGEDLPAAPLPCARPRGKAAAAPEEVLVEDDIFECELQCGFRGSFKEVSAHELLCQHGKAEAAAPAEAARPARGRGGRGNRRRKPEGAGPPAAAGKEGGDIVHPSAKRRPLGCSAVLPTIAPATEHRALETPSSLFAECEPAKPSAPALASDPILDAKDRPRAKKPSAREERPLLERHTELHDGSVALAGGAEGVAAGGGPEGSTAGHRGGAFALGLVRGERKKCPGCNQIVGNGRWRVSRQKGQDAPASASTWWHPQCFLGRYGVSSADSPQQEADAELVKLLESLNSPEGRWRFLVARAPAEARLANEPVGYQGAMRSYLGKRAGGSGTRRQTTHKRLSMGLTSGKKPGLQRLSQMARRLSRA